MLFYEHAEPVSAEKHKNWGLDTGADFSFARQVNSVPMTAVEFPRAALEYVLVFAGGEKEVMPAVILGTADRQNIYVEPSGKWAGRYVPAFVRRYPFVFSSSDNSSLTLCIDGGYKGWSKEGKGQRLFDAKGERTEYLENILKFLQQYQVEFQRTRNFCKKLTDLDLLEPVHAQFTAPGGERRSLAGFMAVSRERLKKLPGDKLAEFAATDELELIYLHLQSLNHFEDLVAKVTGSHSTARAASAQNPGASKGSPRPVAPAQQPAPAKAKKPTAKKPAGK